MIRLMIVDDSATTREMFEYLLGLEPDIEVVAVAKNGEEAVELAARIKLDIILMDINMPKLDGYAASLKIMQDNPVPILLMSATFDVNEVSKIVKAMQIGVLGIYEKPSGMVQAKYKELYEKIVADIRLMSSVKVVRRWNHNSNNSTTNIAPIPVQHHNRTYEFILIGSSTGGPPILYKILKALEADYPLPLLVAQHISKEFIDSFIQWLNEECKVHVKKAIHNEKIVSGTVYIAPKGYHITLENNRISLLEAGVNDLYVPSVSKLFSSVTPYYASKTIAILLSGMGNDGADEITKLRNNGAMCIAQDEDSSVVFGMAKEAIKQGGIDFVLSPDGIVELLLKIEMDKKEIA